MLHRVVGRDHLGAPGTGAGQAGQMAGDPRQPPGSAPPGGGAAPSPMDLHWDIRKEGPTWAGRLHPETKPWLPRLHVPPRGSWQEWGPRDHSSGPGLVGTAEALPNRTWTSVRGCAWCGLRFWFPAFFLCQPPPCGFSEATGHPGPSVSMRIPAGEGGQGPSGVPPALTSTGAAPPQESLQEEMF